MRVGGSVHMLVAVCALSAAFTRLATAQQAAAPHRGVRIPLEFRFASVTYTVLHVDTLDASHGLAIGRTTAYGLQLRHPITRGLAEKWSLEYAGRRNALDQGVCTPGAMPCERPPRAFGYKDWAVRGTTVLTVAPAVLRRHMRWITPFVGAGLGVHAISEPQWRSPTRGRIPITWFVETSEHLETGAHLAIPHTRIVGSGEFRWSWITWRDAPDRLRQTSMSFAVIASL